jgi:hypothetical protein
MASKGSTPAASTNYLAYYQWLTSIRKISYVGSYRSLARCKAPADLERAIGSTVSEPIPLSNGIGMRLASTAVAVISFDPELRHPVLKFSPLGIRVRERLRK